MVFSMKKLLLSVFLLVPSLALAAPSTASDLRGLGMASSLAEAVSNGVSADGDYVLGTDADPQRKLTFGATSDTALSLTFGDGGTTASQTFTISGGAGANDDDTILRLAGGSSIDEAEGAYVLIYGNEASGDINISAGDTANADIILGTQAATSAVKIQDNTTGTLWSFSNAGNLTSDATNGGSLVFGKSTTGLTMTPGTLAAAGTNQGNAAAIVDRITTVTAADGTKGVIFPATPTAGDMYVVLNTANAVLNVYPGSGDFVNGIAVNTAYAMAAYTASWCIASSASQWWCFEGAVPA